MTEKIQYDRQTLFCDPHRANKVHVSIVGLGTVGSNAAKELVKLGVKNLHLVDPDTVEGVNLPSQHYELAHIGKSKVEATLAQLRAIDPQAELTSEVAYLDEHSYLPPGVVVIGVDNMDARRKIMDSLKYRDDITLVIEARMSGDILEMYAFDPTNETERTNWDALWFPQNESTAPACGGQSVAYIGAIVGGLIGAMIAHYVMGRKIRFYTGMTVGAFVGLPEQEDN